MYIKTEFELKHFINYTKKTGGTLTILDADSVGYKTSFNGDIYQIRRDDLDTLMQQDKNLVVVSNIVH